MDKPTKTCKNCGHSCHCDKECPDCVNDVCGKCEHND